HHLDQARTIVQGGLRPSRCRLAADVGSPDAPASLDHPCPCGINRLARLQRAHRSRDNDHATLQRADAWTQCAASRKALRGPPWSDQTQMPPPVRWPEVLAGDAVK